MAFLWADQPTAPAYTPNPSYQFNSSGATNTVVRAGVGAYTVSLPNLGSATGHVQVSAYGTGSERCKVAAWLPSLPAGSAEQVDIRCFTSTGAPADTRFAMTYVDKITLTGGAASPPSVSGPSGAYALADQPTSPSYTPNLSYQWNDFGSTNSITRTGVGAYQVHFPSLAMNTGDVQVTAYGFGSEYCKVKSWGSGGVDVLCFSSAARSVDTPFTVAFLSFYVGTR